MRSYPLIPLAQPQVRKQLIREELNILTFGLTSFAKHLKCLTAFVKHLKCLTNDLNAPPPNPTPPPHPEWGPGAPGPGAPTLGGGVGWGLGGWGVYPAYE